MSDSIRIGIIGTGNIARSYARAYRDIPEAEIVGLCDIVPGKAAAYGEREGFPNAKTYVRYQDMLEELELDAVSISTPNASHGFITVDCLEAGKHVLCEKPMSVTLDEAVNMAKAAKKADKILSIGFQPRYDPNMMAIKDIVQSGVLGKIYYVETGGGRRRGIPGGSFINKEEAGFGAIADIGCYSLDMAMNALGYPKPLTVSAHSRDDFGKSPKYSPAWAPEDFQVEDFGTAFIRLEGDIVLYFKISWAMHLDSMGATFFLGQDAGLKCTPAGTGNWGGAWDGGVGSVTLYHDLQNYQTESPISLRPRPQNFNIFTEKVRDFVFAVKDGGKAPIPGEQIVRNQAIIDGILRSAQSGKEVDIEIPKI
ncbi:MAG: Gfo/Idh/MocA family oxidoreductase [Firmicutes bacterium]|nr:Gfo/Idh/MocA family oxidoreductase [Bacillota bacterium]